MRRGEGLRVRVSRIRGETPSNLLRAPFYFPAIVSQWSYQEEFLHSEYDTVAAGRFSQPARVQRTLSKADRRARPGIDEAPFFRTLTLTVMVMDWDAGFLVESGVSQHDFEANIVPLHRSGKPFELLAALDLKQRPELRMFATLRTLQPSMHEGEVDTRYYDLAISEWRDPSLARRHSGVSRKRGVHLPARHKLTATDTLHSLSMEYYGTYEGWREIAKTNGIHVGQSYHLVLLKRYKVGSIIRIPKIDFATPPGEPSSSLKIPTQEFAPIAGE